MQALLKAASLTIGMTAASICSAQTTPEEFFSELQTLYEMSGTPITVERTTKDGDTLIIEGVSFDFIQDDDFSMIISMGGFSIEPISGGEYDLELVWPETIPISVDVLAKGPNDFEASVKGSLTHKGSHKVGGTDDQRVIQSEMESFAFRLDEVVIPDTDIPPFDLAIGVSNTSSQYVFSLPSKSYRYTVSAEDISLAGNATVEGTTFDLAITVRGSEQEVTGPIVNTQDMAALFGSSVPFTSKATDEGIDLTISGTGAIPFSFAMSVASRVMDVVMAKGGFDFSGELADYAVTVSSGMMPIPPVEVNADTYGFRLALPLVPYEEAGLMALALNFDGLTVSEGLWSLIDPGQLIPRDPATLRVDLTSTASALIDITDPEEQLWLVGMPFEFEDVQLNDLKLAVAGAEVTGSGSADILNDGPFPIPVGAADFRVSGINALISTLIDTQLLQPEQAAPVQMMLGMFATPGEEDDVFTTTVELGEDGSITANGIPLK